MAITATSLDVSSGTSSPPFTTFTVTSPCGSDAFTAAGVHLVRLLHADGDLHLHAP